MKGCRKTIFADVAQQWFLGEKNGPQAIDEMAKNYKKLCNIWDKKHLILAIIFLTQVRINDP